MTEGKFSFPIVHGVRADLTNRQILSTHPITLLFPRTSFLTLSLVADVLQKRPTTPTLKAHTITYLRTHTKSFEYTLSVIRTLEQQTRDEIRRLGGNVGLEKIIDGLHVDGA